MARFIKLLVVLIVWIGFFSLMAQETDDLMDLTLEELLGIEVTAQKRVEKLLDVPVAVTVLQKEQLTMTFANNIESIQAYLPSVSYRKGNTTRNSTLTIRGIGTISFSIAAEPSVSTVVDGVVLGRSGQAFSDLYELERLEVLRGPQGTLFGKNASAGVLNITTTSPTEKTETVLNTRVLQDNELVTTVRVSGPLSDKARGSIALMKADFEGYVDNVYDNETIQGYDRTGIRAKLDYDLSQNLKAKVIMEDYQADDECCADLEGLPSNRNPLSEAVPDSSGVSNGVADIDLTQRRVDHDFETRTLDETTAFSIQIDGTHKDYELTSITAHRVWGNREDREGDFTSIGGDATEPVFGVPFQLHDIGIQEWRQTSQEFRLASPQEKRNVFQIGLFLWNMRSERNFTRFASCQNNAGQNQAILDANPGLTCGSNDIVDATGYMNSEFDNLALFGDGKFKVNKKFRILYGLRYTKDTVSFNHNRVNNDPYGRLGVGVRSAAQNTNFDGETDETNVSAKLGFQVDLTETSRLYGTWAQGYKGPAFNTFYNMAPNDTAPLEAEESDAFEIGYKFTGAKFLINAAVFDTTFSGFQANNFVNLQGSIITRLTNAGDVSTSGGEIDFVYQPNEKLKFFGGLALVNAEIDEFNCPPGAECSARSGLDIPFAPDLKYSISANYTVTKPNYKVIFNGSYIYTDEQYSTLPNNAGVLAPESLLPDYTLVHLFVTYASPDDSFRITLIGKNLLDDEFAVTYSGDGFRYQIPRDADRHFGLAFSKKF